ncbi:MAG: nucleotidyl transferase AbiEii/AbiGii toxin family protein [Bacteroidales bacterium]|nr:nucleotidyl transferase AbiEii/AbiGii toxin family protein [Bacteroidales bacterium]
MIQPELIKNYFPPALRENVVFQKHILKEYLQLLILDFLSTTTYIRKVTFIGGTNLRLVKGIDRFSEDLDFDCKNLSKEEFMGMTDAILQFLQRSGIRVEVRDKESDKLKAFRRNIYFPELLFDLGLTGHKDERFLIKIESQDQQIIYNKVMTNIKGCGLFFSFPVPTNEVLCAMKLSAMLSRQKGRDFYDAMFLLAQAKPDYHFLSVQRGIHNLDELKSATAEILKTVDLKKKMKDFEHLLFNKANAARILRVGEFIDELK